jgi:hypothetical protein
MDGRRNRALIGLIGGDLENPALICTAFLYNNFIKSHGKYYLFRQKYIRMLHYNILRPEPFAGVVLSVGTV